MVSKQVLALGLGVAVALGGAAVWRIGVLEQRLAPTAQTSSVDSAARAVTAPAVSFVGNRPPPENTVMPARGIANVSGVHKCRIAGKFVYRDTHCPAGTEEHALTRGIVTVIPSRGPTVSSTLDRSPARPTARDALVGATEPSLRARQVEQTVNP